jgi:multiple antibiotic resistance protein
MDPLGNVPLFLSALRHVDSARVRSIILRELLIALAILVVFLFIGGLVLELLQVSPAAQLRVIFPAGEPRGEEVREEPFVVPLAIPYTAGP